MCYKWAQKKQNDAHEFPPHYQIKIWSKSDKTKGLPFHVCHPILHLWSFLGMISTFKGGVKSVLMDASTDFSLSITPLIPISGFMLDEKFEIKQHEMKMVKNRAKFEAFRWNIFSSINKSRNWGAQQSTYFKMGHGVFIYKPTILKKVRND